MRKGEAVVKRSCASVAGVETWNVNRFLRFFENILRAEVQMRIVFGLTCVALLMYFPIQANAGNIYGSLWIDGHPAQGAQIQIRCSSSHPTANTDGNGSYSAFVPENGRCGFLVNFQGHSGETTIASYDNPVRYNFDLFRQGDGSYVLRIK
jgi:hypothetical protein